MNNGLKDSLLHVCRLLSKHRVEYLVVGGTAVALHGYFRLSVTAAGKPAEKPDLDFWYNPSYDNYFNLLNVIEELGENVQEFRNEAAPDPKKSFFKLNFEAFTIDFLPSLPGLKKFQPIYRNCEHINFDGIELTFINLDDLITSKVALSRDKDIEDVNELRRRNEQ